jgi:TonB family protein
MTHNTYWPKAFTISCIVHLAFFVLLGVLAGNLPARHVADEYIVIDLTAVSLTGGGGGGGGGGSPAANDIPSQLVNQANALDAASAEAAERLKPQPVQQEPDQSFPAVTETVTAPARNLTLESRPGAAAAAIESGSESALKAMENGKGSGLDGGSGIGSGAGSGSGSGSGAGTGSGSGSGIGSGSGSGTGSGIGSGSGPGVDSAILAFLAEVEKHKEYPYIARRRGYEGVVTLIVELSAAGDLNQVRVVASSGFSPLDDAAAAIISRVTPFKHGLGRPVAMKIPINYRLLP